MSLRRTAAVHRGSFTYKVKKVRDPDGRGCAYKPKQRRLYETPRHYDGAGAQTPRWGRTFTFLGTEFAFVRVGEKK